MNKLNFPVQIKDAQTRNTSIL